MSGDVCVGAGAGNQACATAKQGTFAVATAGAAHAFEDGAALVCECATGAVVCDGGFAGHWYVLKIITTTFSRRVQNANDGARR